MSSLCLAETYLPNLSAPPFVLCNLRKLRNMETTFVQLAKYITQIINWFYKPFKKLVPPETFRYATTGGGNTLFDIFLYFISYNFIFKKHDFDLQIVVISPHIAAFLLVFPITFLTGFYLSRYVTFTNSEVRGKLQLFRYMISVGGSILLNYILLKFFVEYCEFWPTISKIFTTAIVIVYSYTAQRFYTFKTHK